MISHMPHLRAEVTNMRPAGRLPAKHLGEISSLELCLFFGPKSKYEYIVCRLSKC